MIVVDTNILAYLYLPGAHTARAEALLEHEIDSQSVLEAVRDSDCPAYDCEFAALAARLDTRLVTMDAKLLKAFPKRAVALTAVCP